MVMWHHIAALFCNPQVHEARSIARLFYTPGLKPTLLFRSNRLPQHFYLSPFILQIHLPQPFFFPIPDPFS